jgi:hypothetical protein
MSLTAYFAILFVSLAVVFSLTVVVAALTGWWVEFVRKIAPASARWGRAGDDRRLQILQVHGNKPCLDCVIPYGVNGDTRSFPARGCSKTCARIPPVSKRPTSKPVRKPRS